MSVRTGAVPGVALMACALASCDFGGETKGDLLVEGTVFWGPSSAEGVDRAFVHLLDSNHRKVCVVTACDGSFSLRRADAPDLAFPLVVSVERATEPEVRTPKTFARRNPSRAHLVNESCTSCHGPDAHPITLFGSQEVADARKLAPTKSCAPGATPAVVECPENR